MAYRFNPPPNWPIEDANWTPPPGWQPDPSWGPAPDGWNFWVQAEDAPAAPAADDDATRVATTGEQGGAAAADDDATRVATTGEQGGTAPADDDATRVATTGEQGGTAPADDDATRVATTGKQGGTASTDGPTHRDDTAALGADDDATRLATTGEQTGQPDAAADAAPAESASSAPEHADQAPEDDATRLAGGLAAGAAGTMAADGAAQGSSGRDAETAEYTGPDYEAGISQQTPYEAAGEQPQAAPQYGQGTEAPAYGQGTEAPAYGAASSSANGYGADGGYGQPSADGYGESAAAGQPSANGYGDQAAPYEQNYGSASGSDYPAPAYSGSPSEQGTGEGSGWTATTAPADAPKKSILRFWWIGCIILFLIAALVVAGIGAFLLFGGEKQGPQGNGGTTTSASPSNSGTTATSPTATTDAPTTAAVTPTDLPTIDAGAKPQNVVGTKGKGVVKVHMQWMKPDQLPSEYGGNVDPSSKAGGEYLVLTSELEVTDGELDFMSYQFKITTPYGGEISPASETFALKSSGSGIDAPTSFKKGDKYTIRTLFEVEKAGGMQMQFTTYTDDYTWPVPAK